MESLEDYNPDLIFISAGFDAHEHDPLNQFKLTDDDFFVRRLAPLLISAVDDQKA